MATTIDELVVTLGLDPTEFSKGQRQALDDFKKTQESAKKTAGLMESDGKQAARFYTNIKNEALSAIAVLVGARDIGKFTADTVNNLSAVQRIATVMGQATPDVLAVGMAVERIGGNAQAAQQQMLGLSQALERYSRFGEGSLEFKRSLGMIGAGPSDTPLQVLQKFATWAQGKKPQDVELIGQQVGLNQDLINLTIGGRKNFDNQIAQSYKNGIPTEADIKKVQALQQSFGNLAQSVKFAGMELVVDVADPLTHLLNLVSHLTRDFPGATKAVLALVAALITLKGLGIAGGVGKFLVGGGGRAAAGEAAGGIGVGAIAGGAAIAATGIALTGAVSTPGTVGAFQRAIANPDAASDADLRGAIAFAQTNLANAPPAYRTAAASALEKLAQAGLKRWGDPRSGGTANTGGGRVISGARGAGGSLAEQAEAAARAQGVSAEVAHGIAAAVYAEGAKSAGQKDQYDSRGRFAFGAFQFRGEEQRALFAKYGPNPTIAQQIAFFLSRVGNLGSTAQSAAYRTVTGYLRPGEGTAGDLARASRFLGGGPLSGGGGTQVSIGQVVVNTRAQDARAMARDVKSALATEIATNSNGALN